MQIPSNSSLYLQAAPMVREGPGVSLAMSAQHVDWLQSVLFDRGYLARIKGEAIKVYLVIVSECGGQPDRDTTISLRQLMEQTNLSCPTIVDSLTRLESLGLVISTNHGRGKTKSYTIPDPPDLDSMIE